MTMLLALRHRGSPFHLRPRRPTMAIFGGGDVSSRGFARSHRQEVDAAGAEEAGCGRDRVPRALYRQLLVWCRGNDDVPFGPLPPLTLSPPQVNPLALRRLKDMRSFLSANEIEGAARDVDLGETSRFGRSDHPAHYAMHERGVIVGDNLITFPEIGDGRQLRAVVRSIFWLNNRNTVAGADAEGGGSPSPEGGGDGGAREEQISLAFDAVRSCNQLSSNELDGKRDKRESSVRARRVRSGRSDDVGVEYHVGEVVAHRRNEWRGIVVGWAVEGGKGDDNRLSSLTTKQYSSPGLGFVSESARQDGEARQEGDFPSEASDVKVKYTVLVDHFDRDAHGDDSSDGGVPLGKSVTLESQDDLLPVEDPCLRRLHNGLIKQYFIKFDPRGHFVPNDTLAYLYPLDRFSKSNKYGTVEGSDDGTKGEANDSECTPNDAELEKSRSAILDGVREIGRLLLSPLPEPEKQQNESGDDVLQILSSLRSIVQSMLVDDATVTSSLARLNHFHVKLNALMWSRNANRRHAENMKFHLGQIVKHSLYGFRGIIVAWDPKPRVDVSGWDGLRDVVNPQQKPFYHIRPDSNDCVRAFGGPRPFRYVCEDNLEIAPQNERQLELDIDLDQSEWKWDDEKGEYIPSAEMKLMYGEGLSGEASLIATIQDLRGILTDCLIRVRNGDGQGLFSIDDLFCQLRSGVESLEDATIVQDTVKELWKESPNLDLRHQLDRGIAQLMEGDNKNALETFSDIVACDPLYGEAWNKKATVHYMMGEKDSSIEAANEALKIDERNFQALAGIGLIEMDSSNYDKAIDYFQKCLIIHPWLATVSSRLFKCIMIKEHGIERRPPPTWRWSGPL